ncbi:S-layer family protein, partial [Algoriphagus sp.]|uniref:beta strand repeat-containing protein n=1 Tax=Algoriphagus sp. TaxID=1872435 RepID=UPI0027280C25
MQVSGASSGNGNTVLNVGGYQLNISDHITLISSNNNRQAIVNVDGGTVEGNIINLTTGTSGNTGNVNLNLLGNSFLNISGVISISGNSSNLTPSVTSTVNFNGSANQTIAALNYGNLILSGSGTKSFSSGISINGNLSVASGAIANLGSITTHTAGSLTLGGLGTDDGTWGSTSSTATFQNNTFFAATVGRITVNTDTRATPTVTPTIGTYVYNGNQNGPNAATNTGTGTIYTFSYAGVSPTTYGPSSTRPINAGSYTVTATVAASTDGFYKQASSVATPFNIAKANQTITVTTASPASAVFSTGFTVAATASSGLPVAYSSSAPLSNVGADYTMNSGTGTGVVIYNQTGDDNYNAAPEVTANVAAQKAASTISVNAAGPFTFNATPQGPDQVTKSGSAGAVTFSYEGVSGTTYAASSTKPTNAGSYEVTATLAGDANYNGAVSAPLAFSIAKAGSTISVDAAGPFTYNTNPQGPDQVTKSGSAGAVTFSYVGVSGTTYAASSTKPTNAGSYEVTATLAGDDNYNGAVSVPLAFSIAKATLTVTADAGQGKVYGATEPTLTYTITGFVNGDDEADLDTPVSIARA